MGSRCRCSPGRALLLQTCLLLAIPWPSSQKGRDAGSSCTLNRTVGESVQLPLRSYLHPDVREIEWTWDSEDGKKQFLVSWKPGHSSNPDWYDFEKQYKSRFKLTEKASLTIRNLTMEMGGLYTAKVKFHSGKGQEEAFRLCLYGSMASGRKFQPTQDLALSCLSSLMVQHLSSGARLQNCYVSHHRALSVLDIRWWLSRECPPPTPPLVGAGLGGSSNTGGGRASKKNGAGVSKRSFQPVTGVGVWGTSCLLAPAPGSWSCLCAPRLTRSLHSLLSSIILMQAHPVSSGSKRWNPAHPRSVQRVCTVETCTPRRTRAEVFPWPSCSQEPARCSLWAVWSLLFALSVSLFPVSLILLGFSTQ
ncbi:uncharacterized protein RBU33_011726 isoform 2-T2 [Hipposideros larvatus]